MLKSMNLAQRATPINPQLIGYAVFMRTLVSLFFITLGLIAMIAGESDDSPGLQGIGLLIILAVFYFRFWRTRRH
jgi:protein-S-isoprenylcysteine O-methyltransferase Ste14